MKRIILVFVIISLVLSGCAASASSALSYANTTTSAGAVSVTNAISVSQNDEIFEKNVETTTKVITSSHENTVITTKETANLSNEIISQAIKIIRDLKVHFLDVGQSDCIIIELPTGENLIIDAGGNANEQTVLDYLKKIGIKRIDYMFFTHPHEDHIGSLDAVIEKYDIVKLYMPKVTIDTKAYDDVLNAINNKNVEVFYPKVEDYVINDVDNHIYLKVMAPAKEEYVDFNNYSIILKLAYIDASFLFTGDAEDILEYEMIDSGMNIDVDVVKIGHHGSDTSTSEAFLTAASPQYAVISVGKDNTYGLPSQNVIDKLKNAGIEIYRTDELGTIVASSNGKKISFMFEKKKAELESKSEKPEKLTELQTVRTTEQIKSTIKQNINSVEYIGNKNSKVFHRENCRTLPKQSNQKIFNSRDSAINAGYRACKNCKP